MRRLLIIPVFLGLPLLGFGQSQPVNDHQLLTQLSQKVDKLTEKVDMLAENQSKFQQKLDALDLKVVTQAEKTNFQLASMEREISFFSNVSMILLTVFTALLVFIVGFTIWDRRTALNHLNTATMPS